MPWKIRQRMLSAGHGSRYEQPRRFQHVTASDGVSCSRLRDARRQSRVGRTSLKLELGLP
jgi:hypothetical protein